MEPVLAIGAMWRWRAPVLDDIVEFFQRFGAFPSGVPRVAVTPEPPVGRPDAASCRTLSASSIR